MGADRRRAFHRRGNPAVRRAVERLALARVLALGPRVLLLYEPTANLDAANTARVERVIGEWLAQDGRGVLWVSHDAAQLARVAHVRCALNEGRWTAA